MQNDDLSARKGRYKYTQAGEEASQLLDVPRICSLSLSLSFLSCPPSSVVGCLALTLGCPLGRRRWSHLVILVQ